MPVFDPDQLSIADINQGLRQPFMWREPLLAAEKKPTRVWHRKWCFIDIETTGVQPELHSIIDVAAITCDGKGTVSEWESKVRVDDYILKRADKQALEVVGFDASEWEGAPDIVSVIGEFVEFTSGSWLVGHNIQFDVEFLRGAMSRLGYSGHGLSCIGADTYLDAKTHLSQFGLKKFGLDACNEFLGLPREGHHRAIGGARACKRLFEHLRSPRCWQQLLASQNHYQST